MTFYSPYNFVPLQDPQRLEGVDAALSSGIPLRDGLCGSLAIEMEALTPLLVGGERQKRDGATEVHPFRFPDGTYGVPGSSLHGMLRGIVEAVMGGRMRQVDDRRFALRAFIKNVPDYAEKLRSAKAGFLRRRPDGQREIVPCEYALFDHEKLKTFGIPADRFGTAEAKLKASSLRHKYDLLEKAFPGLAVEAVDVARDKTGRMIAKALRRGGDGRFVVSAQINDGTVRRPGGKGNGKHHDFVFFDRKDGNAIPVSAAEWRDFLFTHDDDDPESIRPWPGYWRERHDRGDEVPVFYLKDEVGVRFGLARMFRLAGRTSTHDALRFSHPELLEADGVDLSDALFGTLGDAGKGAARGRVSCAPLVAGPITPENLGATVLGSPKPSYYPAYLYQREGEGWKSKWTHWDSAGNDTPRLRGRKRYYAQDKAKLAPPPEKSGENVHTRLFTLPTGTVLQGRIVVHNLAPFELGALLWAMELGGHASACHQLGMGKPYGMGRVKLRLRAEECRLRPNVAGESTSLDARLEQARTAFRHFMEARIPGWAESVPVRALLNLSNPAAPRPGGLDISRYPVLNPENKGDRKEFDKTATGPGPLPFAVDGDAKPEVSASWRASEEAAAKAAAEAAKEAKRREDEKKYGVTHVSDELVADALLYFKKNEGKLYAIIDKRDHPLPKTLADELLGKLSNKAKDKASDRKLPVIVRYTMLGNSYTVTACELKQ